MNFITMEGCLVWKRLENCNMFYIRNTAIVEIFCEHKKCREVRDFAPDSFWKCEEIGGIAGTARGMNRTHKRTLAGAKLRQLVCNL